MKIIFLGTNGWYDDKNGQTICTLIETKNEYIIFDAGFGLAKAGDYLKPGKPVYIFISHFHLDHICGLHALEKIKVAKKLNFIGGRGLKKYLTLLANHPFTASPKEFGLTLNITELTPGTYRKFPFPLEVLPLRHIDNTLGYRLILEGKVIAYALDTAPCKNASKLGHEADLLITECASLNKGLAAWGHCSPEEAAMMAKGANAKKLVLTHLGTGFDKKIRQKVGGRAKKVFPSTLVANDGLTIKI